MTATTIKQTRVEQLLVEVTTLLVERARAQLEREVAEGNDETAVIQLRRLHEMDKELRAVRRDLGLHESASANEPPQPRQVSKFYEVPGQEDA